MLLFAVVDRFRTGLPARRRESLWQRPSRSARFLRNLLDLSVRPASPAAFVARCGLLVGFALLCHGLGAGAALFIRSAPVPALIVFGALFVCATTNWLSRD